MRGSLDPYAFQFAGEYAMYVDGNGPTDVILSLPAGEYALSWVNVVSGEKSTGSFRHAGGDRTVRTPGLLGVGWRCG